MAFWRVLFWLAAGLLAYTYLLYPLLLWQAHLVVQIHRDWDYLRRRRDRRVPPLPGNAEPGVSLIIPVHNEVAQLPAKLENLRALDYPRERLEIVFISDGSTDGSEAWLAAHAADCTLLALPRCGGKAQALNCGVAAARHPLLVLCDAATELAPDAIRKLARHFQDERVGVACGALEFRATPDSAATEGVYWRYECLLRLMEARLGATLTASGALYALRRACFSPLPAHTLIDDFVLPMAARARGYRVVFDPEARAWDFAASQVEGEFRRRVRLAVGSFRALGALLRAPADLRTRWAFFSHKVLRWFAPFLMLALLAGSLALAAHPFYATALAAQAAFYLWAAFGWHRGATPASSGRHWGWRSSRLAFYLLAMNAAFAIGFFHAVGRRGEVTWQ